MVRGDDIKTDVNHRRHRVSARLHSYFSKGVYKLYGAYFPAALGVFGRGGNHVLTSAKLSGLSAQGIKNLVIPYGIVSIGNDAFWGCTSLESVAFPDTVEFIGEDAFRGCSSLVSLSLPNKLKSVASGAFANCESLKSLDIPVSVLSIEEGAFTNCKVKGVRRTRDFHPGIC